MEGSRTTPVGCSAFPLKSWGKAENPCVRVAYIEHQQSWLRALPRRNVRRVHQRV